MNAGLGRILRLRMRRDRIITPIWILAIALCELATAASYSSLYPTTSDRSPIIAGVNDMPAMLAIAGHAYSDSIGGLLTWKTGVWAALFAGLMTIFLVTRHTRAEEETGRAELVGSGRVGHLTTLTAAIILGIGANIALCIVCTAMLIAAGLPAAGSLAFGFSLLVTGFAFVGIQAIIVQFPDSGRTANGIGLAVVGAFFLLRALGDAGHVSALVWATPLGWSEELRPFGGDRFWVALLVLPLLVITIAIALRLLATRDTGSGMIPAHLGPAVGQLHSALELAWREQRGMLTGFTIGFFALGVACGSIIRNASTFFDESEGATKFIQEMGGGGALADSFIATIAGILGLLAAAYGIAAPLRLRIEENAGRLEPLLATRVTRTGLLGAHLVITVAGMVMMCLIGGVSMGTVYAITSGDMGNLWPSSWAVLIQVPAALILAALTTLLYGVAPRFINGAWGLLALFFVVGQLGPVFGLPQPVMDLSPFTHLPHLPQASVDIVPVLILVILTAGIGLAGFASWRRRDLAAA